MRFYIKTDSNVQEERVMFKRIDELINIHNLKHEIKENHNLRRSYPTLRRKGTLWRCMWFRT